jgi:glutathione S-transferase
MYHYTALVTVLACMLFLYICFLVGRARATFGIKAPATTGHPDFERVYRVQMNTLEWIPIFLPALWLFAVYVNDAVAALIGLVWIAGRLLYAFDYAKAAERRARGFGIQALAALALLLGALAAIVWRILLG